MSVVSDIRYLATSLGYNFIYGTAEYVNAKLDKIDMQTKDVIYMVPVQHTDTYINGMPEYFQYSNVIGLGVKNDGTYQSTLDEFYEQKYDRRLSDMETRLIGFIDSLGCTAGFEITGRRIFSEINKFDANIDVMMGEVQFRYG